MFGRVELRKAFGLAPNWGTPMKLLAFSDIHNNLVCVRKLRSQETNIFDAIIVAGDIGNEAAPAFFKILSTFECPIVYVLGNWDHKLDYKSCFGSRCHALHLNCATIGPLTFTGFSGLTTKQNQKTLIKILRRSGIDFSRTILITHERLWRIGRDMPGLSLHVSRLRRVVSLRKSHTAPAIAATDPPA